MGVLANHVQGLVMAGRDASVTAAGPNPGDVIALIFADRDASVATSGNFISTVVAGNDASVFAKGNVWGKITATAGDISLTSGKSGDSNLTAGNDVTFTVMESLSGTVTAGNNVSGLAWLDVNSSISAAGNVNLAIENDLHGNVTANGNVDVAIMGSQLGDIHADLNISALIGKTAAGKLDAGNNLTLDARDDAIGEIKAGNNADVFVLDGLSGNVDALKEANVVGWGEIKNFIWAEDASVLAAAHLQSIIDADKTAKVTSFKTSLVDIIAKDSIDFTGYGQTTATMESEGPITAVMLDGGSLLAETKGDISLTSLGGLQLTAMSTAGNIEVTSFGGATVEVKAAGDASILSVGALAGVIETDGNASASVVGPANLSITADAGITAFATELLQGHFASAGDISLSGFDVDVTANSNATVNVFGIDDVTAAITAGDNIEVFAGGSLSATLTAGVNVSASSLGSLAAIIYAGQNASAFALGDLAAHITAGNDAQAASYGNLEVDIVAGHDIPIVWARGDIDADLYAANVIDRIMSYGSLDLTATADVINTIEAWGAITGAIEALTEIGVIRSGDDIDLTIDSPDTELVSENDDGVFAKEYPNMPAASLQSVKAFIRGLKRELLDTQASLEELRAGILRVLAADHAGAMEGAGPTLGPKAQSEGAIQIVLNHMFVALETANDEHMAALNNANRNLKLTTDQLHASAATGNLIATHNLEQMNARSALEVEELESSRTDRNKLRDEMLAAKIEQKNSQFIKYNSEKDLWPAVFQQKVWTLVSTRAGQALDMLQLALDALGFVDGTPIGPIADIINAGISLLRGRILDAGINLVSAIPFAGNALKAGKLAGKIAGPVTSALKYADEAMDITTMTTKTIRYSSNAALDFAQMLKPVGKLLSNVPGFCQAARFVSRNSTAFNKFLDAAGVGCFVAGTLYKRLPLDEQDAETAGLSDLLYRYRDLTLVIIAGAGLGAAVAGRRLLKPRKPKREEDPLDELFAQWNAEILAETFDEEVEPTIDWLHDIDHLYADSNNDFITAAAPPTAGLQTAARRLMKGGN